MTFVEFERSLSAAEPPSGVSPLLAALWYDGKGDWDRAHRITQDIEGQDAAWVHAYLHRKEGDAGNAAYWYRRAGRSVAVAPLDREWRAIVESLLSQSPAP